MITFNFDVKIIDMNPFRVITNEKKPQELCLLREISDFGNIFFFINKCDYHSKYFVNRYPFNFSMNFKINFRSFCFLKRLIRLGPQSLFSQCYLFILLEEMNEDFILDHWT